MIAAFSLASFFMLLKFLPFTPQFILQKSILVLVIEPTQNLMIKTKLIPFMQVNTRRHVILCIRLEATMDIEGIRKPLSVG